MCIEKSHSREMRWSVAPSEIASCQTTLLYFLQKIKKIYYCYLFLRGLKGLNTLFVCQAINLTDRCAKRVRKKLFPQKKKTQKKKKAQ